MATQRMPSFWDVMMVGEEKEEGAPVAGCTVLPQARQMD